MKSITPVVSVILLVMLTIAVSAASYFFISSNVNDLQNQGSVETFPGADNSRMNIVSITGSKVIVRNDGTSAVTEFIMFVNGELINYTLDEPIQPGQLRQITFTAQQAGEDLGIKVIYNNGKTIESISPARLNTENSGFTDGSDILGNFFNILSSMDNDLSLFSDLVFMANGNELLVYNNANPASLILLNTVDIPAKSVFDLRIFDYDMGSDLLVSAGNEGLIFYNVESNSITSQHDLGGEIHDFFLIPGFSGNAYVVAGSQGLLTYNSLLGYNGYSFTRLDQDSDAGNVYGLSFAGNVYGLSFNADGGYIYASSDEGLITYNIIDPSNPLKTSKYSTNPINSVFFQADNSNYYAAVKNTGLLTFNIVNPAVPTLDNTNSECTNPTTIFTPFMGDRPNYLQDKLYVGCGNEGLFIYNIVDGSNPVLINSVSEVPVYGISSGDANYHYLYVNSLNRLNVYNIANEELSNNPVLIPQ